jgi:hypothetical protein
LRGSFSCWHNFAFFLWWFIGRDYAATSSTTAARFE